MPRNNSGVYTLPSAAFTPSTTILSASVNSDFSDIATALTQSLATTGVTPMTGAILSADGTAAAPSITFANSVALGFYKSAANEMSLAVAGVQAAKFNSSGLTMVGSGQNITDKNSNIIYGLPIGTIAPYAGSTAPTLWLLCGGQSVSQTTYSALFAVIGTTYGNPGGGNFNLPDLRGRAPFGVDNMGGSAANRITNAGSGIVGTTLGASGGAQNVTLLQANLPNTNLNVTDPQHTHTLSSGTIGMVGGTLIQTGGSGTNNPASITLNSSATNITVASGGSGTAVNLMNPTLILNYIIFAGA